MPPKWEPTSLKRGIPKADVVYAIANATFIDTIEDPGLRGGRVVLYIGPEHGQTARELEVLVEQFDDGREAVIFHVMGLGPKFKRYREEH